MKEFLSNLGGISRENSNKTEGRSQSCDGNSFYEFMQNRKSAIVQSFTSNLPLDTIEMAESTRVSDAAKPSFSAVNTAVISQEVAPLGPPDTEPVFKKGSKLSSLLGEEKFSRFYCC